MAVIYAYSTSRLSPAEHDIIIHHYRQPQYWNFEFNDKGQKGLPHTKEISGPKCPSAAALAVFSQFMTILVFYVFSCLAETDGEGCISLSAAAD